MTIDSHVHFWKYDKKVYAWIDSSMKDLQKDYLPEHLLPTLKRNGVDAIIAVQADQSELDTHFMVEMAKTHSFIQGVVGWTDLRSAELENRLEYFSQYPIIKGWRHIVQGEPDGFLADHDFRRAMPLLQRYGYRYDVLVFASQMAQAVDFVNAFPDNSFILDHAGKPDIRSGEIKEWEKHIRAIAQHPNLYCKLSGLFTEAKWKQWSAAEFYPYLDVLFDAFGPNRLLWGSDWPVMLLSGIYVQWKSLVEKYMEKYTDEDREAVFGGNAVEAYGLE